MRLSRPGRRPLHRVTNSGKAMVGRWQESRAPGSNLPRTRTSRCGGSSPTTARRSTGWPDRWSATRIGRGRDPGDVHPGVAAPRHLPRRGADPCTGCSGSPTTSRSRPSVRSGRSRPTPSGCRSGPSTPTTWWRIGCSSTRPWGARPAQPRRRRAAGGRAAHLRRDQRCAAGADADGQDPIVQGPWPVARAWDRGVAMSWRHPSDTTLGRWSAGTRAAARLATPSTARCAWSGWSRSPSWSRGSARSSGPTSCPGPRGDALWDRLQARIAEREAISVFTELMDVGPETSRVLLEGTVDEGGEDE